MKESTSYRPDNADADRRLRDFLRLCERYSIGSIVWSEFLYLQPEYLHLHEKDIGLTDNTYFMKDYLTQFVYSLGQEVRRDIEQIVFCYSYENQQGASPCACNRKRFYSFVLSDVDKISDPTDIWNAIVGLGRNGNGRLKHTPVAEDRPALLDIEQDLAKALADSHIIQPYLLLGVSTQDQSASDMLENADKLCISNLQEANEKNIADLVRNFSA